MNPKMRVVLKHFKKTDPVLHSLASREKLESMKPRRPAQYYSALCREIVGQQLSGKVAKVIFGRFTELFDGKKITAEQTLRLNENALRNTGMAWAKVAAVKDLAQKAIDGTVDLKKLNELDDIRVVESLMQVKGVGPWTAQMFLMFTLGREDVFSPGDLGLKKAIMRHYGMRKEPTEKKLMQITKKWSPYRTYASLALWNAVNE